MDKIKIGVIGGSGRMGQQIIHKVLNSVDFSLEAVFARRSLTGVPHVAQIAEAFEKSEVIIDFSSAMLLETVLEQARLFHKPLIIGTTGLNQHHHKSIAQTALTIPIVYSANMSIGIALLKKAVSYFAQKLDASFDRDIVEFHHRHKKDAPSGTSLALVQCLMADQEVSLERLHTSPVTPRPEGKVAVAVVHAGGILADQQVHFTSDSEHLTLSHRCLDRGVYAEGALKAARWILKRVPQLYTMEDVLDITPWTV